MIFDCKLVILQLLIYILGGDEVTKKSEKVNGSLDPEVFDLRRQIEKQATDLGSAHRSLSDLRSKNAELEERLMQINKELHGAQEFAKSLDIELKVRKFWVFLWLFLGRFGYFWVLLDSFNAYQQRTL